MFVKGLFQLVQNLYELVKVTMVTVRGAICHLLCELLLDSKK